MQEMLARDDLKSFLYYIAYKIKSIEDVCSIPHFS